MLLKELREKFHKSLDSIYGKEEVDSFFFLLLEYYLKLKRIDAALKPNLEIEGLHLQDFLFALEGLEAQKPIQYIIGETEFCGLVFKVNNNVLIPRPETEELINWIVKYCNPEKTITILDIGTGSGCIAICLAKLLPKSKVYALDISREALKVAKENSRHNKVDVSFIHNNILEESHSLLVESIKFDIVVSNPPYVRYSEKELMKSNVLDNEPHLALFVDNEDPLHFYRTICKFSVNNLKENGKLFFEINEYLGGQMLKLFERFPFEDVEIKKDVFNKDRMLKASKM